MVLLSSRQSCPLKDPRIASTLHAMGSFKSSMYLPIVETTWERRSGLNEALSKVLLFLLMLETLGQM